MIFVSAMMFYTMPEVLRQQRFSLMRNSKNESLDFKSSIRNNFCHMCNPFWVSDVMKTFGWSAMPCNNRVLP